MSRRSEQARRDAFARDLRIEQATASRLAYETPTLTQVALAQGRARLVAWIPTAFAVEGQRLTVEGRDGVWRVTEVFATAPTVPREDGALVCVSLTGM